MNCMMQNFRHKEWCTFLNSGGNDRGAMLSSFSELNDGLNNDTRHPLVQQEKNNCGFQDDNQARIYIRNMPQGLIIENANNDPQGMSSLFGNVSGGGVVVGGQHYVLTKKA
jgi:hypothetical protein